MNKLVIKAIEKYQKDISPSKNVKCRHSPTCSAYAKTAFERFNFVKASFLSTKRILTCNPLFKPKYDPVPEKKIRKSKKSLEDKVEENIKDK